MSTQPVQNVAAAPAIRAKLPQTRTGTNHRFNVGGYEGYVIVNEYPDGRPGEIFIRVAKEGSTLGGLMDSISLLTSIALQHGVPLKLLCEKFRNTRFEPQGWSDNKEIGYATSIVDYIFRYLEARFLGRTNKNQPDEKQDQAHLAYQVEESDAPLCQYCGIIMTRAGSCHTCSSCGTTSGCG